jgi:internalin A
MSKDLEIIKQIENKTGQKLPRVEPADIFGWTNGYVFDYDLNIICLNLYKLGLTEISFIKDLKNLTELYLSSTQVSDLSSLEGLENLTRLDLSDTQVSDLSSLKGLQNLWYLDLSYTQVSDISPLRDLENLKRLDLRNCQISRLPVDIGGWGLEIRWEYDSFGGGIFLEGNPLEVPPVEIVKQGTEAVAAYFGALEGEGEKRALNEVKVLLVGDGGAGKTSLAKRLLGEEFDRNESQTHGINIRQWAVDQGEATIKVRLWDFGGQEIMHATHQFFLSRRSLYILVLDGRKDEKTEYWLKHVRTFGSDSPVLVVINKID